VGRGCQPISKAVSSERKTFLTTFRDSFSSRQICLIGLPWTKYARRILAIVSTTPVGDLDFNCCPDPDCTNFGVSADVNVERFLGRGAPARKAAVLSNSSAMGLGAYKIHSSSQKEIRRVSTAFEYANNPHTWMDGREIRCQAARQKGPCDAGFALLSNDHLLDEIDRLRRANGVLDGPACGSCGRLYLDAPHEFVLNGANGRKTREHDRATP
jgi:hypothetical protein